MNTINNRKTKIIERLQNKEYRDSFVSSNIDVGVAFQIRALRKQRSYTQIEMAEISGMKQERISALENPSNTPNIRTLKRIANALDVGIIVKFVSIGELVELQLNLSDDSLNVPSFTDDRYFQATNEDTIDYNKYTETSRPIAADKVISIKDFSAEKVSPLPPRTIYATATDGKHFMYS